MNTTTTTGDTTMDISRKPDTAYITALDIPKGVQGQLLRDALQYCDAEDDIKRYAAEITRDCERIIANVNNGHRTSEEFLNDRRLKEACAKRQRAADELVRLIWTINHFTEGRVAVEFDYLIVIDRKA